MIVTFYSYKGGVGRSFCLANIAVQLANWGNRVLCVDWDLEAPGLHEYFRAWLPEPPQRGVVELVTEDGPLDWRSAVLPVRIPNVERLDLLAAGRTDSGYVDRVQAISWPRLYAENDLGWRFEQFAEELRAEYDFVLIDSRTGITDIGGICTAQLPDVLVLCLTPNRQSLDGATDVARRAAAARNHLPYDKSALLVLPVVSRFDGREEYQRAQQWRREITGYCAPFYTSWVPKQVPATQVVERTTVPYLPYWSFGEELPAITENSANPEMVTHYLDNIAALIAHRLADAHILGANRDAYVTSARARSNRTDQLADIGVYGGSPEHAREVRAALTALGLQVLPPPAPPEGTRAALVLSDRHSRSGPWNDVMEQAASSRIASLNWINNDAPPAEVAARAVRFFGGVLRDLPPRWADALVKTGEWHLANDQVDDARDALSCAEYVAPGAPGPRWLGARIAFHEGDYPAVISALAGAPDLDGPQLAMLGRAYMAEGMTDDAERAYTRALLLDDPADAIQVRRDLAAIAAQTGDDDLAVEHLKLAMDEADEGTLPWLEVSVDLAVLYRRRGSVPVAEEILRGVIASDGPPALRLEASRHLADMQEQTGFHMVVATWAISAGLAEEADDIDALQEAVRGVIRTRGIGIKPLADMAVLVGRARERADGERRVAESASLRELSGVLRLALLDFNEAAQELEIGLTTYRKLRDNAGIARCLIHLARVDRRTDRVERAAARLAEATSLLPTLRGAQAEVVRDLIDRG